jgi:PIN domain nuclease of toxin-antitoxin system
MISRYILDACALIAYLNDEDGADAVESLLNQAYDGNALISIGMVNLLEVYYGVYRDVGADKADNILDEILLLPITVKKEINLDELREAGRLKVSHKMSLADSLVLGMASVSGDFIVTADHHEFDSVQASEHIKFHWIR